MRLFQKLTAIVSLCITATIAQAVTFTPGDSYVATFDFGDDPAIQDYYIARVSAAFGADIIDPFEDVRYQIYGADDALIADMTFRRDFAPFERDNDFASSAHMIFYDFILPTPSTSGTLVVSSIGDSTFELTELSLLMFPRYTPTQDQALFDRLVPVTPTQVPIPATGLLLLTALVTVARWRR